jgi:hypothetical protein
LENREALLILDDAVARRLAFTLDLKATGTLGLQVDAKRAGLIDVVAPLLDQLELLRFRLASHTRAAVLRMSSET